MIALVIGGSGSGKSAYAEQMAVKAAGNGSLYYVATMQVYDEEGKKKVERHQKMRAGKGFLTIEQPRRLEEAAKKVAAESVPAEIASAGKVTTEKAPTGVEKTVLLECMSNLVANEMFQENGSHEKTVKAVIDGVCHLKEQTENLVIVTNEIFSETADYQGDTERYQEYLGKINQGLANISDEVVEVVYGIPIYHKTEGQSV